MSHGGSPAGPGDREEGSPGAGLLAALALSRGLTRGLLRGVLKLHSLLQRQAGTLQRQRHSVHSALRSTGMIETQMPCNLWTHKAW